MSNQRNFAVLEDRAVVLLARMGDKAAYSELVRRNQSWVRNLLRRLCGNAALADDLGQQAFLAAWLGLAQLRSVDAFRGWLRSLAVTTWLKQRRGRTPLDAAAEIDALPLSVADSAPGAQADLERALALLSEAERLCVVLCYHEGLSHAEVAALAALPLGTVKSHIQRGRQKLQARLAAYSEASTTGKANDRH